MFQTRGLLGPVECATSADRVAYDEYNDIAAMANRRRHLSLSMRMVEPQMMHKDHVLYSSLFGTLVSPYLESVQRMLSKVMQYVPLDIFAFINHREAEKPPVKPNE